LNQKGLTLLELVIAMAIATLVVGAASAVWFQMSTGSDRDTKYMAAFTQVQNAGSWITRDAVQAQQVYDTSGLVTLAWVDWEGNSHQVMYTLEGSGELRRSYSINSGAPETTLVAVYIDSSTTCDWDEDERMLTLVIMAQVGERSASRTYKVEPRPLS